MSTQQPSKRPTLRERLVSPRILRVVLIVAAGYLVLSIALGVVAGLAHASWLVAIAPLVEGAIGGALAVILTKRSIPSPGPGGRGDGSPGA
jgi:hypothetical protein